MHINQKYQVKNWGRFCSCVVGYLELRIIQATRKGSYNFMVTSYALIRFKRDKDDLSHIWF